MEPNAVPPPVAMTQMLAGFQVSQALYVVAKLGVPDALAAGPRPIAEVADELGAQPDALYRLARDLTAVGVFSQPEPGVFALGPLGSTLASGPGSVRDLAIMWMETHYGPFGELLHTARTGEPAATKHYGQPFFDWLSASPEQVARFSAAMANATDGLREDAIAGHSLGEVGTIVDVGGADGSVLAQYLHRHPGAKGVLFDLPHVVADVGDLLHERGIADRTEVVAGSFFEKVPPGDVYLLSFILHDWNDDECVRILQVIAADAPAHAQLAVLEAVVPETDEPHLGKMIDITMLGMLTGRERTETEWTALFARAGWRLDRIVPGETSIRVLEVVRAD